MQMKTKTYFITQTAVFAALIAVCAWISIPAAVSFTLQTFGVCLAGALGGKKAGTVSVAVYILLGLVGVPVFSGFQGGAGALAGPTGGYIVGFLFTAFIAGAFADRFGHKFWVSVLGMALGVAVCYAFGTVWFYILYNRSGSAMTWGGVLSVCVVPFLPFDAVKIVLAAALAKTLAPRLKKLEKEG